MADRADNPKMRRALLTLVALALTAALTGCGVSSTVDPVAAAATKTENAGGYKMTMSVKMSAGATSGTMTAQGTFDRDRGEMEMDLGDLMGGLGASAGNGTLRARYLTEDGDPVMYMQFGFLAGMLPAGKTWIRIDLQKAGKGLGIDFNQLMGGVGQNPSSSLDLLRSSGDFTEVGKETVDGVDTTHYHGVVDLKKAAAGGGPASEAIQHLEQLGATTQFPMDVWIDDSGMIRRFTQSFDQSLGGQTMSLETTMDISDYGTPVDVTAPPADQVFDATALAGQGTQSQPGATTTTAAPA